MSRKGKAKTLNHQEFKRVESMIMINKHSKRNLCILHFSFKLAMRSCEIRQLRLGDVLELDGKTIRDELILTKTKGDKARTISLANKKLREILQDYIIYLLQLYEKKRMIFSFNNPLFLSQRGSFFHPAQIVMLFQKFYKDAGIEKAKSHSGRRTFITTKIDEGVNIKYISSIAGHSNISMTVKYHDVNPQIIKKIMEKDIF